MSGEGSQETRWLDWARRVQALAQNGLTYTEGTFDRERYLELRSIAAGMLAALGDAAPERVEDLFSRETGYSTPKVDVRGAVFHEGRILLVREMDDGRWALPGGWVDGGLAPSEAVVKEIEEETGYRTRAARLLAVYERERHGVPPLPWHVYKLMVGCELLGGEPRGSIETTEVGWFAEDALPPMSEGRTTAAQVRRMFEHLRHPHWPADFD